MSEILTRKCSAFPARPLIIRYEGVSHNWVHISVDTPNHPSSSSRSDWSAQMADDHVDASIHDRTTGITVECNLTDMQKEVQRGGSFDDIVSPAERAERCSAEDDPGNKG